MCNCLLLQKDGGQLALYNAACCKMPGATSADLEQAVGYSAGEPALMVAPLAGRLLVFDSRLEHEVLPAYRHRFSVTAFFYRAKPGKAQYPDPTSADENRAGVGDQSASVLCGQTSLPTALDTQQGPSLSTAVSGLSSSSLPRIFVSIAAFRDEECQWTLRDLFLKAKHPQRVFVGVVWQIDPVADQSFVRVAGGDRTAPYLQQVSE